VTFINTKLEFEREEVRGDDGPCRQEHFSLSGVFLPGIPEKGTRIEVRGAVFTVDRMPTLLGLVHGDHETKRAMVLHVEWTSITRPDGVRVCPHNSDWDVVQAFVKKAGIEIVR
jgi:hypothetical protein